MPLAPATGATSVAFWGEVPVGALLSDIPAGAAGFVNWYLTGGFPSASYLGESGSLSGSVLTTAGLTAGYFECFNMTGGYLRSLETLQVTVQGPCHFDQFRVSMQFVFDAVFVPRQPFGAILPADGITTQITSYQAVTTMAVNPLYS